MAKSKVEVVDEGSGTSKMQMVREAMALLGGDPKPRMIHEQVMSQYGTDIPTAMISSYKSMIQKKTGEGRTTNRGPRGGTSAFSVDDLESVRTLIERVGSENLIQIIRFLAK